MAISFYHAGSWLYELDASAIGSVGSADPGYLAKLLGKIHECIVILGKDELFVPTSVTLSRWIDIDGEEKTDLDIGDDSAELAFAPGMRLDQLISAMVVAKQNAAGTVRPRSIAIRGWTRAPQQGSDDGKVPDLVSVDASFMGGGEIKIRVFGDLWLPFSLDGTKSNAAYPQFADILETALDDVEHTLGVEPIFDEVGDICMINGYRLENFTDSDGEILGVDWRGSVL